MSILYKNQFENALNKTFNLKIYEKILKYIYKISF